MKEKIFRFVTAVKDSILKRITVKNDVVSIYNGKQSDFYNSDHTITLWTAEAKQCNAACSGKPYKGIEESHLLHRLISPHTSTKEQKGEHIHVQHCQIVTPEDFSCLLDQIEKFQNDPVLRNKVFQQQKRANALAYALFKREFKADLEHDYLKPADIAAAKAKYQKFYNKHKTTIEKQYQQVQADLSWSDEFAELGNNFINAGLNGCLFTSGLSFLEEGLKAYGVKAENTKKFVEAVSMIIVAATGTTWTPVIVAGAISAACHWLKSGANETQMCKSIALTLTIFRQYSPTTAYGFLNLAVALTGSAVGSYLGNLSRSVSHSFWGYISGSSVKTSSIQVTDSVTPRPVPGLN